MFVLGRIATAHVAADQALAQVYPGIAHLQAFFAALCAGLDFSDFSDMAARLACHSTLHDVNVFMMHPGQ
jgi:hypothetical protein